ncbi:homeobox protein 5 isoform X2 [Uranotaenia lowii]|uniref:homeobox protein 5 isoform X2 n=1 Tax=Uranotaenia lowii TaxID=190385 RepID=UPI0024794209|nr:homeobox protein 5 isoform X2 [Uranotaenia lowii]
MREVDSSETSVVWPAWCYSGETTVNEDLPQATSAAAVAQLNLNLNPGHRTSHHQQHQQSSSNQSQSSSASSSPSSVHHHQQHQAASLAVSSRKLSSSRSKRKSITPSTSPSAAAANTTTSTSSPPPSSALSAAAALSVSSVAALAAAAAAAFQASPGRHSTPPGYHHPERNGNGLGRGSPLSAPTTPTSNDPDPNNYHQHHTSLGVNFNNNNISSQVAALQSVGKMLSERIYDRKKYLNSPTGSVAASFYEKFRNGAAAAAAAAAAASAGEVDLGQLNLIKRGQSPLTGSELVISAINSSGNSVSVSGSNSVNNGPNGLLVAVANGNCVDGSSGGQHNSLNNNQNNSSNNNSISSSSIGSTNNSNNNSIKSERMSPSNNDVQSTASRSRSVTPSSFSGTPPQTMHSADVAFPSSIPSSGLLPSPNSALGMATAAAAAGGTLIPGRPEFQARNYSDFMRSLAAKYNNNNISSSSNINNNNNGSSDQSSVKNPFLEPKMRINQPKSFIENSLAAVGSKKGSPITSAQVPNPSIMSSLFPGLPFQPAVFPPLIDMSSTQALVALARAAKESGIQNLLKPEDGGLKKPSAGSRSSSPPLGGSHFPSPFPSRYLPGLLPNHLTNPGGSYPAGPVSGSTTTAVPAISPLKSPNRSSLEGISSTFPLDLSAAPSSAKRIKLSPNPSHRNQQSSPAPSSSSPPSAEDLKLARKCHARIEEISAWTVDNVCDFVASIDICAEYVQVGE